MRMRKSLVISKKDLLSPTKTKERKDKLFNKRLLGSGKKTEPVPFNLTEAVQSQGNPVEFKSIRQRFDQFF